MIALLLRLAGPMQAWGTQSRFSIRDTQLEPSKSGVVGLLASALGRQRSESIADLAALEMAVRVDREGRKLRDFHTVGGGTLPPEVLRRYDVREYGVSKANDSTPDTAISSRFYLADASFLVALGSPDRALLESLANALRNPTYQIFLGRKSFVPAEHVLHDWPNPLREGSTLRDILEREPWTPRQDELRWDRESNQRAPGVKNLRIVLQADDRVGSERNDIPVSFEKGKRRHAIRSVRIEFTAMPIDQWRVANLRPRKENAA